jgi:hypothetical protein
MLLLGIGDTASNIKVCWDILQDISDLNKNIWITLILTAWEFKKPFFVKMKLSPGWFKQNIF